MTRVPAGAAGLVTAAVAGGAPGGRGRRRHAVPGGDGDGFGDGLPTQPIAVGRCQVGLVLDDRHRRAPDPTGPRTPSERHDASTRSARLTILIATVVVIAAAIGALGYQRLASSSPWAASEAPARPVPATSPATPHPPADHVPRPPLPQRSDDRHGDRRGALGEADGAVPDGVTVFDDEVPAVANLDPALLDALRQAATEAAADRVEFVVNSGWRSREYQEHLLDEAISKYGSKKEAARWVATADTSPHVSGNAIDIGPTGATAWLSEHGADHGLCRIYRNEPWHYELRPDAVDDGCPPMYADPTHDPRMQQ